MKLKTAFLATTAMLAAGNVMALDASFYGQVNKIGVYLDDGEDSSTAIVDNDTSSTRFGVKAQQQLDNGLVVSALLEVESQTEDSFNHDFSNDGINSDTASVKERHSRIGLGTNFGTFLIGNTSEANDGISEQDLGGVQDLMYSDITSIGGAATFKHKNGDNSLIELKKTYSDLDGGRTSLIRYDTPVFNGLSGSASVSSGGDIALAAKTSGYISENTKLKAGLGFKKHNADNAGDVEHDISGSLSIKNEATGLAATASAGIRSSKTSGRDDYKFIYTKLSYAPVTSNLEFAADIARSEDVTSTGGEVTSFGVGSQYNIADGVSSSIMYRKIMGSDDLSSEDVQDIDIVTAGIRVKF
ncbi:MAG: porin [Proteobacteria bacterium]|nr:porin [Pseudomonadota bacterium]